MMGTCLASDATTDRHKRVAPNNVMADKLGNLGGRCASSCGCGQLGTCSHITWPSHRVQGIHILACGQPRSNPVIIACVEHRAHNVMIGHYSASNINGASCPERHDRLGLTPRQHAAGAAPAAPRCQWDCSIFHVRWSRMTVLVYTLQLPIARR